MFVKIRCYTLLISAGVGHTARTSQPIKYLFPVFKAFNQVILAIVTIMPSIQVFNRLQPVLNLMKVYNSENFHGNRLAVFRHILKLIGLSVLLFVIPFEIALDFWYCVNCKFNLDETALPISVILYDTQLFLIYISFAMNNREISASFDRIHEIIARSTGPVGFFIYFF